VVRRDGRLLIAQRPLDGLLGGLWEFPGGKQEGDETLQQCLERELLEELDIRVRVGQQIAVVKHAYTHFRVTVYAFECECLSAEDPKALGVRDWRWITMRELDDYAFPVVDRKIIDVLLEPWEQASFDLDAHAENATRSSVRVEGTHDQKS
jgi:A/G-specific adenine glycosylase